MVPYWTSHFVLPTLLFFAASSGKCQPKKFKIRENIIPDLFYGFNLLNRIQMGSDIRLFA